MKGIVTIASIWGNETSNWHDASGNEDGFGFEKSPASISEPIPENLVPPSGPPPGTTLEPPAPPASDVPPSDVAPVGPLTPPTSEPGVGPGEGPGEGTGMGTGAGGGGKEECMWHE